MTHCRWADALMATIKNNAVEAGITGADSDETTMRKQFKAATILLAFIPEDRGPHMIHAVCKPWYADQMRQLRGNERVYKVRSESWSDICNQLATEC